MTKMLKVLILLLAFQFSSVHARGFRRYCSLEGDSIYQITRDSVTRQLFFGNGTRENSIVKAGSRRRLSIPHSVEESSVLEEWQDAPALDALRVKRRTSDMVDGALSEVILMRECSCARTQEKVFCPVFLSDYGIPSYSRSDRFDQTPGCVNFSRRKDFVRSIFLVVVALYALITISMFTNFGKDVIGF